MKTFFDAVVAAVQQEEITLNQLFASNKDFYVKHHHGVCNLYETTFVYLAFKELLKRQYPLMIHWEYPYPSNPFEHSDMALLNKNGKPDSLIEFKIWTKDHDREIKADVAKLQKESGCKKYIVVFGYGGDIQENHDYLTKSNPALKEIEKKQLVTQFFKTKEGVIGDNNLNIFMYEVL